MYVFENLDLLQNAMKMAAAVEFASEEFPPSTEYFRDRLIRLASTIPSHIAEAHGHWKDEERREFFWKAREATQECAGLIDVAARQGLMAGHIKLYIRNRLDSLQRGIQDIIRTTEKRMDIPVAQMTGPHGLTVV